MTLGNIEHSAAAIRVELQNFIDSPAALAVMTMAPDSGTMCVVPDFNLSGGIVRNLLVGRNSHQRARATSLRRCLVSISIFKHGP
jgi:hypothetical protein